MDLVESFPGLVISVALITCEDWDISVMMQLGPGRLHSDSDMITIRMMPETPEQVVVGLRHEIANSHEVTMRY